MKKLLYIFYIPLLLLEWLADMLVSIVKVIHNSIETLTLVLQKEINEPISEEVEQPATPEPVNREPVSGDSEDRRRPAANDRRAVSRVRG